MAIKSYSHPRGKVVLQGLVLSKSWSPTFEKKTNKEHHTRDIFYFYCCHVRLSKCLWKREISPFTLQRPFDIQPFTVATRKKKSHNHFFLLCDKTLGFAIHQNINILPPTFGTIHCTQVSSR